MHYRSWVVLYTKTFQEVVIYMGGRQNSELFELGVGAAERLRFNGSVDDPFEDTRPRVWAPYSGLSGNLAWASLSG